MVVVGEMVEFTQNMEEEGGEGVTMITNEHVPVCYLPYVRFILSIFLNT